MSRRIAIGFLISAAIIMLALAAATHLYIAFYPYQVNYVEGFVLDDALRLGSLESIYSDPSSQPYSLSVYTPLYPLLVGGLSKLTGPAMGPGRAVSLIAFGVLCWLVASRVARRSGPGAGLAAGVTLAASAAFHPWAALVKPDLLGLALSFGGLYALQPSNAGESGGRWRLPAAALLLAAGLWTKQSFIAAPAAALLWLAPGSRREALRLGLWIAVLVAIPAGALQWATDGWFAHHVVAANINPWNWTRVAVFWRAFVAVHPLVIVLAAATALDAVRRRRLGLPGVYVVAALAVSLTVGKNGSDHNYLLEPLTALVWWIGTSVDWRDRLRRRRWLSWAVIGVLAAQWALFVPGSLRDVRLASATRAGLAQVHDWVATVPDPIISDEAGLLALNRRPVVLQPFVMTQMAQAGLWDDGPLVRDLAAARFNAVILAVEPPGVITTRYTRAAREAIAASYAEVGSFTSMGYRHVVMIPLRALPPDDRP